MLACYLDAKRRQIFIIGTDGVWEARNRAGEMFGKERLMELICRQASSIVDNMVSAIMQFVHEFQGSVRQEDDITFFVIRVDDGPVREHST